MDVKVDTSNTVSERLLKLHGPWKSDSAKDMYVWEPECDRLIATKCLGTEVQQRIRQAYWDYVNSTFEQVDGESNLRQEQSSKCNKRFWSFIKHARTDKSGITSVKAGNVVLTNSSSKAALLNEQFKSVFFQHGPMKLKDIAEAALNQQIYGQHCHSCMAPVDITVEAVRKLLSNLNPYNAVGPDSIHPHVLKELSAVIAPALCNIFRTSLQSGVVPSDRKQAYVTPIYKKRPKQLPGKLQTSFTYMYL